MEQKVFCKNCKRKIIQGPLGFGSEPTIEFEDGVYCDKCGRAKMEKSRKQ